MFSGIGGFRSGLEAAGGYECIGFCEIDKNAAKAYRAIYNTEKEAYFSDAREIDTAELGEFDLLVAGFPCQPFSVCGRKLGFSDTRGTLFYEIARIIKAKRPAFFVLENVPGLLSHDEGKTFNVILEALSELGYSFEWMVHNSANFGVPQQRKRVYIVGYLNGKCSGKVFPLRCMYAENLRQIIPGSQGSRVYDINGVACTQCAGSGGDGAKTGLYFIDQNVNPKITDHARCITARQDSGVSKRIGEHSGVLVEDLPIPVINPAKESTRQNGRRMKNPDESMFTITVQDRHGVIHKGRIRKLMPIECWRLQGFTDEQFYKVQNLGMADSALFKMAGNAVSVPVIKALGERIKELMNDESICKRG